MSYANPTSKRAIVDPRRKELRKALKDKGYYIQTSYKDPRIGNRFSHKIEVSARERQGPKDRLSPEQGKEIIDIVTSIIPEAWCTPFSYSVKCTWESEGAPALHNN